MPKSTSVGSLSIIGWLNSEVNADGQKKPGGANAKTQESEMNTTSPKSPAIFTASIMLALAPAAALVFLWPTASAQAPARTAYAHVSLGDVRGQDAGALRAAQSRIEAAARSVCTEVAIHSPLLPREQADCQRETVANAMDQLIENGRKLTVASAD
jgi:UrcA family protein